MFIKWRGYGWMLLLVVMQCHLGSLAAIQQVSLQEALEKGTTAYTEGDWEVARSWLRPVLAGRYVLEEPWEKEAALHLGIAEYYCGNWEAAHKALNLYLRQRQGVERFYTALEYEFAIAEALRGGGRLCLLSSPALPRWSSGERLALEIYDEIALVAPTHELAVRSLCAKANILASMDLFQESLATYQLILRRYPHHALAACAYDGMLMVYLQQVSYERQDSEALVLARLTLGKFRECFPGHKLLARSEQALLRLEEIYADRLYQTGYFYENTRLPCSAVIYYSTAVKQFPHTQTAEICRQKLQALGRYVPPVLLADDACAKKVVSF